MTLRSAPLIHWNIFIKQTFGQNHKMPRLETCYNATAENARMLLVLNAFMGNIEVTFLP